MQHYPTTRIQFKIQFVIIFTFYKANEISYFQVDISEYTIFHKYTHMNISQFLMYVFDLEICMLKSNCQHCAISPILVSFFKNAIDNVHFLWC